MKSLKNLWINFWGNNYRVYEDDKEVYRILIYHKKIYIKKVGR